MYCTLPKEKVVHKKRNKNRGGERGGKTESKRERKKERRKKKKEKKAETRQSACTSGSGYQWISVTRVSETFFFF